MYSEIIFFYDFTIQSMIMLVKSFLTEIQIERQNSLLYSIKTAKSNDLHRAKIMHSPNSPPPSVCHGMCVIASLQK